MSRLSCLRVDDPFIATTQYSCLSRPDIADKLEKQLERATAMDDQLLMGGTRDNNKIEPTVVLSGPESPLVKEEVVGGVLVL